MHGPNFDKVFGTKNATSECKHMQYYPLFNTIIDEFIINN